MRKKVLLFMGLFLMMATSMFAQYTYSLYVGESKYFDAPRPPAGFKLNKTAWGCDEAGIKVSRFGDGVKITITDYFTSKGKLWCDYYYYDADNKRTGNSTEYYFIECKRVDISLDKTTLELKEGKSYSLQESFSPSSAPQPTVTWSSSDESIATVSKYGTVTGVKKGVAVITAKTNSQTSAQCKVTVTASNIPAESIKIAEKEQLTVGKSVILNYKITPDDATSKVTYSSSDTSVATVNDEGLVTAKKKGTATITVKTDNGKKSECKLTVVPPTQAEIDEMNKEILDDSYVKTGEFMSNFNYRLYLWQKENY